VAIAAIKGIQTTGQIASAFEVHPTQIGLWKKQALQGLSEVFSDKRRKAHDDNEALIAELYKTIGQRDMELSWLKKNLKRFEHSG
jgi:transposase-like protein